MSVLAQATEHTKVLPVQLATQCPPQNLTTEIHSSTTLWLTELRTAPPQSPLQNQTKKAAQKVMEIMETASPKYALAAAQDILDRGGHRPVDIVEHVNKMDGELRIVHITKDEKLLNSVQDVEFTEIK